MNLTLPDYGLKVVLPLCLLLLLSLPSKTTCASTFTANSYKEVFVVLALVELPRSKGLGLSFRVQLSSTVGFIGGLQLKP